MIRPGAQIGAFELLARLGQGGQGETFLARPWMPCERTRHISRRRLLTLRAFGVLNGAGAHHYRLATVKIAHPGWSDSLHDEHEYLAAPGRAHQHLVRLYDAVNVGRNLGLLLDPEGRRRVYLALAYVPGHSLEQLRPYLRRAACATLAVTVALQLASALAQLHRQGLIHHDVRPANVVVRGPPSGAVHATLIDLGAAETLDAPRRRAVYAVPHYLPPERRGAEPAPACPQVDSYALGVMLHELTLPTRRSSALAALIADATADERHRREAIIPTMDVFQARLAALPETSF